jgi:hypothetical protein
MSDEKACKQTKLQAEQEKHWEQEQLVADLMRHLRAAGIVCELRDIKTH